MAIDITRLLFIDSYDSFTFNLAALCRQSIPNCSIYIIKNDEFNIQNLLPYLGYFSAIIVGPGPGSPDIVDDIGVVSDLWRISEDYLLPIFGVCLGLQSLGIEFGARLCRLPVVKHGQKSHIQHVGDDLFDGVGSVHAVRYHSLHIELKEAVNLECLAWTEDLENGRVVMALKHKTRPFWAVQYHPESICTEGGGVEVIRNFWRLAQSWSQKMGRYVRPWDSSVNDRIGQSWPHIPLHSSFRAPSNASTTVTTAELHLPQLTVTTVCELLGSSDESSRFALLDSAAQPGRFSIIPTFSSTSLQITYSVPDTFVRLTRDNATVCEELGSHNIWSWLSSYMRQRKANGGRPEVPFWGGLVGFLSYELGVNSLQIPLKRFEGLEQRHSDVNLMFAERSVVMDSATGSVYIQSTIPRDDKWITTTSGIFAKAAVPQTKVVTLCNPADLNSCTPVITPPDKARYISRINLAKEHLFVGDSYELCLTAQTRIHIHHSKSSSTSPSSSWERYKMLRRSNPAPHSAYLRLHPTTLLSSSPERFLSFSRSPGSICQLRPIKGTVRKGPEIDRAAAEKALAGSTKEVAENLMIVDLIRHDLHGIVGEDVRVKQFCGVEEYETVWQLVSVIEGRLGNNSTYQNILDDELGWQVLQNSLPPGSMTGAPKKRSVEILQTLEEQERSAYSGVFGYWCVGGGGDWSVTIRSCFKYDDQYGVETRASNTDKNTAPEEWVIGAGGAITALSDAEAEWEEMVVKLRSVLRSFGVLDVDESVV